MSYKAPTKNYADELNQRIEDTHDHIAELEKEIQRHKEQIDRWHDFLRTLGTCPHCKSHYLTSVSYYEFECDWCQKHWIFEPDAEEFFEVG